MKTHIAQILEAKIKQNDRLTVDEKDELMILIASIDNTMQQLAKTHVQDAEKIQQLADDGAHTALTRGLKEMREEMSESIQTFEVTHPELVDLVNRLCIMLANLGI